MLCFIQNENMLLLFSLQAVRAIEKSGLQCIAMFAQAWVYEHLGSVNYYKNERKFWDILQTLLSPRRPRSLPLIADFNIGQGKCFCREGEAGSHYLLLVC